MARRPRRAGPVWAWALGLLILIFLLVWFVVGRGGQAATPRADMPAASRVTDEAGTGPPAVDPGSPSRTPVESAPTPP